MNDVLDKLNEIISKAESIKEIMTDDTMFDSWIESSLENCISELEQALYYLEDNETEVTSNDDTDDENDTEHHNSDYDSF